MELCEADIVRLERGGNLREDFCISGPDGIRRLRNRDGYCVFHDRGLSRCTQYARRPLGCVLYPVNMSLDGEIVVDDLCPEANTVSAEERSRNGERLRLLLDTITSEAEKAKRAR